MLVRENDEVEALIASTGEDFYRRRDDRVGGVVNPAFTTLPFLYCQLCLPNCFALSFWSPLWDGFVPLLRTAGSNCFRIAIMD